MYLSLGGIIVASQNRIAWGFEIVYSFIKISICSGECNCLICTLFCLFLNYLYTTQIGCLALQVHVIVYTPSYGYFRTVRLEIHGTKNDSMPHWWGY